MQAAGAAGVGVAGFWVLGSGEHARARASRARSIRASGVDGLSGLFLGTLGVVAAPALVVLARATSSRHGRGRAVAALTAAFLLALALVVCARDPLTFLAGWELMTLLPAAVILVARGADRPSRQTVFVYLAVTHLGGVGTWVAMLLLAAGGRDRRAAAIDAGSGLQTRSRWRRSSGWARRRA